MKIAPVKNLINSGVNSHVTNLFQGRYQAFENGISYAQINYKWHDITNAFYYPVSFSSSKERTYSTDKRRLAEKSGDFKISRYNDIPCPACGKKMLNVNKFSEIAEELSELPPEQYLECLGKYKEYMRPVEESVYNEISDLSKNTGEKDIRQLVVSLRNKKLPLLQKVQLRKVNKMRALAKTLPNDEQRVLLKKVAGLASIIRKTNPEAPFRRKIMLERISKVKLRNPKKYEKLQRIAESFPTSSDMNSAWIVKYSGKNKMDKDWTSLEIATRFLSSSMANTDHIIAYDIDNNHDDITNYMAMHCSCNSEKANKPFLQWLNEDKNGRFENMKKYFNDVDGLISARRLRKKKYRGYVAKATETIEQASKGQIPASTLRPDKNVNTVDSIIQGIPKDINKKKEVS